mmetsp:Transcript_1642/g.5395  ORF Transcript_1642/g.5395 Transcript_1642/m.5395 type:complete len:211 (+) Transcript_1642:490-1122(+)
MARAAPAEPARARAYCASARRPASLSFSPSRQSVAATSCAARPELRCLNSAKPGSCCHDARIARGSRTRWTTCTDEAWGAAERVGVASAPAERAPSNRPSTVALDAAAAPLAPPAAEPLSAPIRRSSCPLMRIVLTAMCLHAHAGVTALRARLHRPPRASAALSLLSSTRSLSEIWQSSTRERKAALSSPLRTIACPKCARKRARSGSYR